MRAVKKMLAAAKMSAKMSAKAGWKKLVSKNLKIKNFLVKVLDI